MLSKKILRLKKKIKLIEESYLSKLFDQKLSLLNNKIDNQEKIIKELESKVLILEESANKDISKVKSGINLMLDTVTELEDYRDTCSKDITTLASAITELYNVLNYVLGGKLLIKKESSDEEEIFFEDDLDFEEFIDDDGKKKKKKVIH